MQLTETLHSPESFIEWLNSQPLNKPVGQAITVCRCPIAEWLRSLRYDRIVIGSTSVVAYWGTNAQLLVRNPAHDQQPMPDWVFCFVQWLDDLVRVGQVSLEPTPLECLYILKRYCNCKDAQVRN